MMRFQRRRILNAKRNQDPIRENQAEGTTSIRIRICAHPKAAEG